MDIVTNGKAVFVQASDVFGTPGILARRVDGTGPTAAIGQFLEDGTFARRKDNAEALKALGFQVETDGGIKIA